MREIDVESQTVVTEYYSKLFGAVVNDLHIIIVRTVPIGLDLGRCQTRNKVEPLCRSAFLHDKVARLDFASCPTFDESRN